MRPEWFSRWVRNPAQIVPRMEMPAIQTAVKGVLNNSLDQQLAALWTTLNTPDFRPPGEDHRSLIILSHIRNGLGC